MTLTSEIARIAALRGKPAHNYQVQATVGRRIQSAEIRALFRIGDNTRAEFEAYDTLPSRSRMVLSELPIPASAIRYWDLLDRCEDEAFLIDAVRDQVPGVVRDWVLDHYGRGHPSARRLG